MQPQQLSGHLLNSTCMLQTGQHRIVPNKSRSLHKLQRDTCYMESAVSATQLEISLGLGLAVKQHQPNMTQNRCHQSVQHGQQG